MDKELFDYLCDLKIKNIKLNKEMELFTDKGINRYLERKVDIVLDALNDLKRCKLIAPQLDRVFDKIYKDFDKLEEEYKKAMEEL